ncbi:MAG: hypothetical protein CMH57_03235 [Myxococcales bacterium]|nr:hypothetical protein [Myxococcales bacterium]
MDLEFSDTGYRVWYEPDTHTVFFEGSLRLNTADYAPLSAMLKEIVAADPPRLTLHLRGLEFLNSSGINALYKFTIALRRRPGGAPPLTLLSSRAIAWQAKSLPNIKRFLPSATIETV